MRALRAVTFAITAALVACTAEPAAREPTPGPPTEEPTPEPAVYLVHPTRPPLSISNATAEALEQGRIDDWRALGEPPGRLRIVRGPRAAAGVGRDRSALALATSADIRPGVRAISVDGIDPVRDPVGYGLTGRAATELLLVGDIMLGSRVARKARNDPTFPFRLVAARLKQADLTVGNFESTLARHGPPTQDDAFAADPATLAGLRLAGIDLVSLANNHTGDFGPRSLTETVRLLRRAGIRTVGAGANDTEARAPVVIARNGVRFGFLAFNAIGETPAATATRPGAVSIRMQPRTGPLNRGDLRRMTEAVRALERDADVVLVYPHWGQQYSHRAHPDQRRVARALIEAGADAVVATHPHWVQGLALHRGKPVAYSLGNFVFDQTFVPQVKQGIALEMIFWGRRLVAIEPIPVRIDDDYRPRFQSWLEGREVLADVFAASSAPWRIR